MEDFVVYHNADVMGYSAKDLDDLVAFATKLERDIQGHRVWLVGGEGKPRRYYLRSYFLVDRVENAKNGQPGKLLKGRTGKLLDSMPVLNDEDWFRELRQNQCNFRFGLRAVQSRKAIIGLQQAAGIQSRNSNGFSELAPSLDGNTDSGSNSRRIEKSTRRRIVGNAKQRRKKLIAFGWYGGKFSHLDFILPNLPNDAQHFCDVFGGSAAVLINRDPAPLETYNDLDEELVNFFSVLRGNGQKLIKAISLTPFSRQELIQAVTPEKNLSSLERARRFYVRARQTRTGLAQTSSEGRWAHCVLTSRAGMAGAVSRWLGAIDGLPEIVQRLQRIQIENVPALELIERYDTPQTLFYLDPPYVHESRSDSKAYGHEMSDFDHVNLAAALNSIKGRAVLSGYRTRLYDELYRDWNRVDADEKIINSSKAVRQESLWMNFSPLMKNLNENAG